MNMSTMTPVEKDFVYSIKSYLDHYGLIREYWHPVCDEIDRIGVRQFVNKYVKWYDGLHLSGLEDTREFPRYIDLAKLKR